MSYNKTTQTNQIKPNQIPLKAENNTISRSEYASSQVSFS